MADYGLIVQARQLARELVVQQKYRGSYKIPAALFSGSKVAPERANDFLHFRGRAQARHVPIYGAGTVVRENAKKQNVVRVGVQQKTGFFGSRGAILVLVTPGRHNQDKGFSHDQRGGYGSAHANIGFELDGQALKVVQALYSDSVDRFVRWVCRCLLDGMFQGQVVGTELNIAEAYLLNETTYRYSAELVTANNTHTLRDINRGIDWHSAV